MQSEADLLKAVYVRHAAYARHVPDFARTLAFPESYDAEPGVVVLLAESKVDSSPLGTMRIQTNRYKPLGLEQSVTLPAWMSDLRLAEATRLGVVGKGGRMVKAALFKAVFQYCQQSGVAFIVVSARHPVDRQYDQLLFTDVFPGMGYIPLAHVCNLEHRIMKISVAGVRPLWSESSHSLFKFFFKTAHPDIDVSPRRAPLVVFPTAGFQECAGLR